MLSLLKFVPRVFLMLTGDFMPVAGSFAMAASDVVGISMVKLSRVGSGKCLIALADAERGDSPVEDGDMA